MPVTRIVLKDGELTTSQKINERIRLLCNVDEETFYGSIGNARIKNIGFCGIGTDIVTGYMEGLRRGLYGPAKGDSK